MTVHKNFNEKFFITYEIKQYKNFKTFLMIFLKQKTLIKRFYSYIKKIIMSFVKQPLMKKSQLPIKQLK